MLTINCIIPTSGKAVSLPLVKQCLKHLHKATATHVRIKIFIVSTENKSRKQLLSSTIDNFYLVDSSLGFSEMNNIGIEESLRFYESDYYLFINDDAEINRVFFAKLVQLLSQDQPDLINPLIFEKTSQQIDSFGVEYFTSGYAKNVNRQNVPAQLATACCLLVKTSFLVKMHQSYGFYFNPIFHYYLEDVEFGIRARAIGGSIVRYPGLVVTHAGSATSGKKSRFVLYHTYRNLLWIIYLTWPTKVLLKHLPSIALVQGWVFLYSLIRFPFLYLEVWFSTLVHLKELFRLRKKIILCYPKNFQFESIFSQFAFRTTKQGITMKANIFSIMQFWWHYLTNEKDAHKTKAFFPPYNI